MFRAPQNEDLATRLSRLRWELSGLEEMLAVAAADPEGLNASRRELGEFKDVLENLRRFLWLYLRTHSHPSEAAEGPLLSLEGATMPGVVDEIQNVVSGLFEKHCPRGEPRA